MNYLRPLEIGKTGEDVKILQEKLNILNYKNEVTGSFGNATNEAVINFQKNNDIEADGIVGYKTWDELYGQTSIAINVTYETLKYGDTGSLVLELQTKLKGTLYYTGDINQKFDYQTLVAVKRFQYNNKITADGIVGNNTWFYLNSRYSIKSNCNEVSSDYYTVKKGDTLFSIAKAFNTTVTVLKELNNKESNLISIGEKLKIKEDSDEYIVKKGDTLFSISKKFNMPVDEIIRINNLKSDILEIGQTLKINQQSGDYYTVKKGDTLYSIANNYKTKVDELIKLNNLENSTIIIGQKLLIPTETYTVKLGDTLYSIAKEYNTTVDDLIKKNKLSNNMIVTGQKIII